MCLFLSGHCLYFALFVQHIFIPFLFHAITLTTLLHNANQRQPSLNGGNDDTGYSAVAVVENGSNSNSGEAGGSSSAEHGGSSSR